VAPYKRIFEEANIPDNVWNYILGPVVLFVLYVGRGMFSLATKLINRELDAKTQMENRITSLTDRVFELERELGRWES
jgi:hypothetical protein